VHDTLEVVSVLRKVLLVCGIASSLLYVGVDLLAAALHSQSHSFRSQALSELTAIGAPTASLAVPLFLAYDGLLIAFGVGVGASRGPQRRLRVVGGLLIAIAAVGLVWPPMQRRGTGSAGGDVPHIVGAGVEVVLILAAIGIGASLFGRRFRRYSFVTLVVFLMSGVALGFQGAALAAGEATPWLGIVERINLGAYLLWVAVLALNLLGWWRSIPTVYSAQRCSGVGRG
jgi:hypothetical protein